MARLWSSGFELNKLESSGGSIVGMEWNLNQTGTIITTVTSPVHGGTYAAKVNGAGGTNELWHVFNTSNGNGPYWARVYIYITTPPNVSNSIFELDAANGSTVAAIFLNTDGSIKLENHSGTVIGTSSALTQNVWHSIEVKADLTGAAGHKIIEARVDGSVFATTSTDDVTSQAGSIFLGSDLEINGLTSGIWYYDDVAINDSTGSFQNGYPGEGKIIHQNPAGAGDSTQWTIGGSAPAATNWQSVNEIPPDDAVTLVSESVLNKSDFYTVGTSVVGAGDLVKVVQVGARFRNNTADATTAFQIQIEKASAGTVSKSSSIVPNTTTWTTNTVVGNTTTANPYQLTLYQDPDSANWTNSTINSMQIGMIAGTVGVNAIQVSNVWALVEFFQVDITLSDTTATSENPNVATVDTFSTNDATATSDPVPSYYTDQTDVVEMVNMAEVDTFQVSDTAVDTESIIFLVFEFIAVSDTATSGESTFFLISNNMVQSDTTATSEALLIDLEAQPNVVDLLSTSESLVMLLQADPKVSDTTTTSESVNLFVAESITVSDTTTTDESAVVLEQSANDTVITSDSVSTAESISLMVVTSISVSDTTTTSESIKPQSIELVNTSDTTTTSESELVIKQGGLFVSDSVTTAENTSVIINNLLVAVSDSTATSEVILFPGSGASVQDSVTTSEFVAVATGRGITRTTTLTVVIPSAVDFSFIKKDV